MRDPNSSLSNVCVNDCMACYIIGLMWLSLLCLNHLTHLYLQLESDCVMFMLNYACMFIVRFHIVIGAL